MVYKFRKPRGTLGLKFALVAAVAILLTGGLAWGRAFADPTYTVSGNITVGGQPLVGATVSIIGSQQSGQTDSDGDYSVSSVPDGSYQIQVDEIRSTLDFVNTRSQAAIIDVNNGDVNQDLSFNTDTITVTADDTAGNPVSGASISAVNTNDASTISDSNGDVFYAQQGDIQSGNATNSNGQTMLSVFPGQTYTVCDVYIGNDASSSIEGNGVSDCAYQNVTVNSDTTASLTIPPPPTPTNLSATSPTNQYPMLSWSAPTNQQNQVNHYNIYRNGVYLASSNTTSYRDTDSSLLTYNTSSNDVYSVTAVGLYGLESAPSNAMTVIVDSIPPKIDFSVSPQPNSNGWNNSPATVTYACSSNVPGVGIAYCSPPKTVSINGFLRVPGTVTDDAGNTNEVNPSVEVDQTPPTVSAGSWSANPVEEGQSATLTAPASDTVSGVVGGEYYVGSNDPGEGNASPMTYSDGNLSATFNNLTPGTYAVNFRSEDAAGNWSTTTSTNLVVNAVLAPTSLTASSPTLNAPALSWNTVGGATSYNIYRNGSEIGSTTSNSYIDTSAVAGNTYSYYVTAVNSNGESPASNTINVLFGSSPILTSDSSTTVNARDQLNFTVTTTGDPVASITESGSLPTGVSFKDNGDGTATFSGQPSPINQGYYFITLTAANSLGSTTQSFVLTVNDAQTVPTFVSTNSASAVYGTPFSFTVDTTGNPIPNITKLSGSGSLPAGLKLTDNNDGTATISGTVTGKQTSGTYTFTLKAKNKNGTVEQPFTLTVAD